MCGYCAAENKNSQKQNNLIRNMEQGSFIVCRLENNLGIVSNFMLLHFTCNSYYAFILIDLGLHVK